MATYEIWKDGEKSNSVEVEAADMNSALDIAAVEFGFVDYADMSQAEGWDSENGDGLNINEVRV